MLINKYVSKLKHHVGSKRFCRLRNVIIYLNEEANISSIFMTYTKNVNGRKVEEVFDFPPATLDVTDEFKGKKSYHMVSLHPLVVESYML